MPITMLIPQEFRLKLKSCDILIIREMVRKKNILWAHQILTRFKRNRLKSQTDDGHRLDSPEKFQPLFRRS